MNQSELERRAKQIAGEDGFMEIFPYTEELEIRGFYTFVDIRKLQSLLRLLAEEGYED